MTHVDQRGRRHKNDLQDPEANEGDGEDTVIADCLATWLVSIADKFGLLIIPYILNEEYGEPDLDAAQQVPVTHGQLLTTSLPHVLKLWKHNMYCVSSTKPD
uniref:Uncharacterized protein n=1 Tax=Monopterus albus TaxID=43700 RepID=A0A3Q3JE15_MONAL